jgi:hypothetical protein
MLEYMSKEESLYILEQSREKYEWDVANRIQSARLLFASQADYACAI